MTPRRTLPCPACGAQLRVAVERAPESTSATSVQGRGKQGVASSPVAASSPALDLVVGAYTATFPRGRVTETGRGCILRLLRDGVPSTAMVEAIWGCKASEWHVERGRTGMAQILENESQVEMFRGKLQAHEARRGQPTLSERSKGTVGAVARYLKRGGGDGE